MFFSVSIEITAPSHSFVEGNNVRFRMPSLNVNRNFMRDLFKCSQKFAFRRTVQWTRGNNLSRVSIDPSYKMKIALHKIRIDDSRRTIEIWNEQIIVICTLVVVGAFAIVINSNWNWQLRFSGESFVSFRNWYAARCLASRALRHIIKCRTTFGLSYFLQ